MVSRVRTVAFHGIEVMPIDVQVQAASGMPTFAIVTLDDVIAHLAGREIDGRVVLDEERVAAIEAYRMRYGASRKTG